MGGIEDEDIIFLSVRQVWMRLTQLYRLLLMYQQQVYNMIIDKYAEVFHNLLIHP